MENMEICQTGLGGFQTLRLTFDLSPTDGTEACQGMGRGLAGDGMFF
jgi:hypothetical protein